MLVSSFFWSVCVMVFLGGCAPSSLGEYRREGEALCRRFTRDLQNIETREELAIALPILKERFEEIVDLIIETKNFQEEHLDIATDIWTSPDFLASEALMVEVRRLYQLEGGRGIMENAQREALFRLDAALRKDKQLSHPRREL